jgi:hypothetical protein
MVNSPCRVLLVENDRSDFPCDIGIARKITQLAAIGIPLDQNNPRVLLLPNRQQSACLVDGKLTRVAASTRSLLNGCETSSLGVDGEVDERI